MRVTKGGKSSGEQEVEGELGKGRTDLKRTTRGR